MFKAFDVRLGPINFSIVLNTTLRSSGLFGGFFTRADTGVFSTLRIGKVYVNFDIC